MPHLKWEGKCPSASAVDFIGILLIALALAVDAFAVALSTGVVLPRIGFREIFRLAWHFGLFQSLMNILGWAGGLAFRSLIQAFDHWIAFLLLAFVGIRMIVEALRSGDDEQKTNPTRGKTLIVLSVATSIDSLAVGLSFSMLKISIWLPALIIGIVAAAMTVAGLLLGRFVRRARLLGSATEILGGMVLLAIGIRVLQEHGVFSHFFN